MNNYRIIADKIIEIFQNGFIIVEKVLHYIDSTFRDNTAEGIIEILSGFESERESLLRLVFSPDEAMQSLFENVLARIDISRDDIDHLKEYLSACEIQSRIIFPDERGSINVPIPPAVLLHFTDSLNLSVKFHDQLAESFKCIISDRMRILAKVKIRNTGKNFSGKEVDFLCRFFEKMGSEEESIFIEYLEAAIEILEYTNAGSDIYKALSDKKGALFHSLTSADRFEEMLKVNNIETLLLQGVRPVSVDKEAVMRNIATIDRICLAVFGKTQYHER